MAASMPASMRALTLPCYCKPEDYDVATVPTPEISKGDEILIKVHAASINPIDVKLAGGDLKMMVSHSFPYLVGFDFAGTVIAIGSEVTSLRVGDEVYTRAPNTLKGSVAQYALSTESTTAKMPRNVNFTDAASIPLASQTAFQALQIAEQKLAGGLKGKTVFVPAGLSATGNAALQLAKNVFGAGKVITTLSTGKLAKYKDLIGANTVDEVIDYTKGDVLKATGTGTVDFIFDTIGGTFTFLPMMKSGGVIVSISTLPSGDEMVVQFGDGVPFIARYLLNFVDLISRWRASRFGVEYSYLFMEPNAKDLESLATFVEEGKLLPVVGRTAKLNDIVGLRAGCQEVYDAKGGVGKFVINMI